MRKFLFIICIVLLSSLSSFSQPNCDDQYLFDMSLNNYQYQQNIAFCDSYYGGYSTTSGVNCLTLALQAWSGNDAQNYSAYMNCKRPIAKNSRKKVAKIALV